MYKFIVKNAVKLYYKIFYKFRVYGLENIPTDTGFIVCANHIHLADPLVIGVSIKENIHFMAKKELFKFKPFAWFFKSVGGFPVDRQNVNEISAIRTSLKLLKNDKSLLLFAEGTRNRTGKPLKAKPGVAMLAIKSKKPVLPVTVDSKYKFFSEIRIVFHKPVYFTEYFNQKLTTEDYQKLTQDIINDIYDKIKILK